MPIRTPTRSAVVLAAQQQRTADALRRENARLTQENARLLAAQQSVRRLLGILTHDMRSRLSVVKEYSSLVREGLAGETTPRQSHYLEVVGQRADDLAWMIDGLHDVCALAAGTLRMWRRECQLDDAIAPWRAIWVQRAESRRVALDVADTSDLPAVFCDEDKIGRVINRLVIDAIMAAPAGGEVRLWTRTHGSHVALVGITCVGRTIDDEALRSLSAALDRAEFDAAAVDAIGPLMAAAQAVVRLNLGELRFDGAMPDACSYSVALPIYDPLAIIELHARRLMGAGGHEATALLRASLDADRSPQAAPLVDEYLQSAISAQDLALEVRPRQWLLIVGCRRDEAADLCSRLTAGWIDSMRESPLDPMPRLDATVVGVWGADDAPAALVREAHRLCEALPSDGFMGQRQCTLAACSAAGAPA